MTDRPDLSSWLNEEDDRPQERSDPLDNVLGESRTPDEVAQERSVASRVGAPAPAVRAYPDLYGRRAEVQRTREATDDAPRLRQWLDQPDNYAVARDDAENLGLFERIWRGFTAPAQSANEQLGRDVARLTPGISLVETLRSQFSPRGAGGARPDIFGNEQARQGELDVEFGRLAFRRRQLEADGVFSAEDQARLDELATREGQDNWGPFVIGPTRRLIPQVVGSLTQAADQAGARAGQTWENPFEGLALVPGFRGAPTIVDVSPSDRSVARRVLEGTVAAAPLAAATGVSAVGGGIGGYIAFGNEMETGVAYDAMRREGVPADVAGEYADQYGLWASGIEFAGLGGTLKATGASRLVTRFLRERVLNQARTVAAQRAAGSVLASTAEQGAEEMAQELAQVIHQDLARQVTESGSGDVGQAWLAAMTPEAIERLLMSGYIGAQGGAGMAIVPAGANLTLDLRAAERAERSAAVFEQMAQAAQASQVGARLPSALQSAVDAVSDGGEIFIDADRFVEHFQSAGANAYAVADELGIGSDRLAQALGSHGQVSIPAGAFAAQVLRIPAHAPLAQHARLSPTDSTPAEVQMAGELFKAEIERVVADAEVSAADADIGKAVETRMRDLFARAEDEGGYRPEIAARYAKLAAALPRALLARARAAGNTEYAARLEGQLQTLFGENLDIAGPTRGMEGAGAELRQADVNTNDSRLDNVAEGSRPLSPDERYAVAAAVAGYSNDDIATHLQARSVQSVRVLLSKAKKKLGQQIWEARRLGRAPTLDYDALVRVREQLRKQGVPEHRLLARLAERFGADYNTVYKTLARNGSASQELGQDGAEDPAQSSAFRQRLERVEKELAGDDAGAATSGEGGADSSPAGEGAQAGGEYQSDAPVKDGDARDPELGRDARLALSVSGITLTPTGDVDLGTLRLRVDLAAMAPARLRDALTEHPDERAHSAEIRFHLIENGIDVAVPDLRHDFAQDGVYLSYISAPDALKQTGVGSWLYRQLIDWAHRRGLDFYSDATISADAWKAYATTLVEFGYDVERINYAVQFDGKTYESDDMRPIWVVRAGNGSAALNTSTEAAPLPEGDYQINGPTLKQRLADGAAELNQFAGEGAVTADLGSLDAAKRMQEAGASADDIWSQTGWALGDDGQWRFEIDTNGARITVPLRQVRETQIRALSEVLDFPALYAAYPQMADVPIDLALGAPEGSWDRTHGSVANAGGAGRPFEFIPLITVRARSLAGARVTLLHELQHAIQDIEAFATGGSPESFKQQQDAQLARDALSWRRELDVAAKENPGADVSALDNIVAEKYADMGAADWMPSAEARNVAMDRAGNPAEELQKIIDLYGLDRQVTARSPLDVYRRLSGEVEARNVERRSGMTSEEKRATAPNVTADIPAPERIVVMARPDAAFSVSMQGAKRGSIRYDGFKAGEFGQAMIRMGEASDLSTFLHEFGHLGHLVLESIATDQSAPAEFKQMWETTLQWWGVDQAAWDGLSVEQRTQYYELWARSFEAYLMEGKAPSLSLREAFAAFKAWLTQIYRSVFALDAKLDPQIRDVFDRMLATDAEIAEARAAMGADFSLAREAFKTDEEFQVYQQAIADAREAADGELRARVMDTFIRKEKRWWRSERARVRTTAEIEVDSDPARRAYEWLAFGEWRPMPVETDDDGNIAPPDPSLAMPEGLPEMKLDPQVLVEDYGDGVFQDLPVGLRPARPEDVDAALEQAMALKRQARVRQPQRLWAFIKAQGGIRDDGGEISQALGSARVRPGLINNATGVDADELALRAWEAGYFGPKPRRGGVMFQGPALDAGNGGGGPLEGDVLPPSRDIAMRRETSPADARLADALERVRTDAQAHLDERGYVLDPNAPPIDPTTLDGDRLYVHRFTEGLGEFSRRARALRGEGADPLSDIVPRLRSPALPDGALSRIDAGNGGGGPFPAPRALDGGNAGEWVTMYRGQNAKFNDEFPEFAYLTTDPPIAAQALGDAEGGAIYPVQVRFDRLAELDGRAMEDLGYRPEHIAELRAQGYDGAFSGNEYLIFDMQNNVRSALTRGAFGVSPQDGGPRVGLRMEFDAGRWSILDGDTVIEQLPRGATSKQATAALRARQAPARGNDVHPGFEMFQSAPVFVSAVERTVEQSKTARAPGAQWWATISKAPGVKKEELQWLGLEDFLKAREGQVSREEVLQFVRDNGVRVEETVLAGDGMQTPEEAAIMQREALPLIEERDRLRREEEVLRERDYDQFSDAEKARIQEIASRQDAIEAALDEVQARMDGVSSAGQTKWSQYTLPGGENYRELLLRLPVRLGEGQSSPDYAVRLSENARRNFKSSHYDEPNILAHVRFKERVDSEGRRTLFIEEVQSDWHQAGRERGYRDGSQEAREREIEAELAEIEASRDSRGFLSMDASARRAELRTEQNGMDTARVRAVPDAPFKNNAWANLSLKRMIRWAAENGFEQIAWTPGRVQVERFDLAKQVDAVQWARKYDDTVDIYTVRNGTQTRVGAYALRDLGGVVGQDLAAKIADQHASGAANGELTGNDLRVGGEGMAAFYDRIMVNIANDLGKKYGARVGETAIPLPSNAAETSAYKPSDYRVEERDGGWIVTQDRSRAPGTPVFATKAEADARRAKIVAQFSPVPETVHSLPITPEMREAVVGRGQELFQGQDDGFTADRRPTPRELLDALIDDLKNVRQVYSSDDADAVAAYQNRADAQRWFESRGVDLAATKDVIREQIIAAMNREAENPNGAHYDDVAEWFGFGSGDEMIQALRGLKPRAEAIEENIERRLEAEHGDPMRDGTVAEAARLAAHVAAQSRKIELELEAIERATNGRSRPVGAAAKAYAERQLLSMTVKQIRGYDTFLAGERRAARASLEAFKKGDLQTAQTHKQRQLISFHLYRLARNASEEMDKAQRYFQKFDSATVRSRIHAPLMDQIDQALEGIDLRGKPPLSNKRRQTFLAWFQEMQAEGLEHMVVVDPDFLDQVRQRPFASLSLEEARSMRDAVRNFEHIGRRWREVLAARDARLLDEEVALMAASMAEVKPFAIANPDNHSPGPIEKIDSARQSAHAFNSRVEFIARAMDNMQENGPVWNGLFRPLTEARDREEIRQEQAQEAIEGLFSVYTAKERADMWTVRKHYDQVPNRDGSRMGRAFTKQEILAIALNTGNEYNLNALLQGEAKTSRATEQQIRALLDAAMDQRDWAFVQSLWDYVDSFYPEIETLYLKSAGVAPAKVQATPFQNRHGEWRGGYWPATYDFGRDQRARDEFENGAVQAAFGGFRLASQTPNSFAKARQGSGGRPILLDLSVLSQHVNGVIHDLEFRLPVLNAWRLVKHQGFRDAFVRAAGQEQYDRLKPWLQYIATERMPPERVFAGALRLLRRNTPIALMGYAISTVAQQPAGLLGTMHRVGVGRVMGKALELASQPWTWMEHARFINTRSTLMRNRTRISQREVREMVQEINSDGHIDAVNLMVNGNARQKAQALGHVNKLMQRYALFPLAFLDKWISSVAWKAAYDRALAGQVKGVDAANEADVISYADQIIRTTFGSGRPEDLPEIMRSSELGKLITPAFSYFNTQYNQLYNEQVPGAMRGKISPIEFMTFIMLTLVMQALVSEWAAGRWEPDDGEDEDERNARLAIAVAQTPLAGIPLIRDMTRAALNKAATGERSFGTSVPAVGAITTTGGALGGTFYDLANEGEISRATARDLTMAAGYWFGLPSRQAWTTGSYISDVAGGQEDAPWDSSEPVDAWSEALLRDTR